MFDAHRFHVRCDGCAAEKIVDGYDTAEQFYERHTQHSDQVVIVKKQE